jgi:uncharacterized protein (TIGR03437 family)
MSTAALRLMAVALCLCFAVERIQAQPITPPEQPATGPGGSAAPYSFSQSSYGTGGTEFWLYLPQPMPSSAPVVVFLHGWGAMQPASYEFWLQHIARRGNIVIYPRYQENVSEPVPNMTTNAIASIRAALSLLGSAADLSKVALVSHSFGGVISFNIAARAASEGLPIPKAISTAAPGEVAISGVPGGLEVEKLSQISDRTLIQVLIGESDNVAGDATARKIIRAIPHIANKNFIIIPSDNRGNPPLIADHLAPLAGQRSSFGEVNALDYNGYWKLSDALMDYAFYGTDSEYALGGDDRQVSLGSWSDGSPVKSIMLRPTLSVPGIVNAASLRPGPVAPGEMVTIFGAGLGPRSREFLSTDSGNLIRSDLGGMQVLFQGIPSPVILSSMNQASVLVPYAIAGLGSASVQLQYNNFVSEAVTVGVAPASVGVFTANSTGSGPASVINQNSTMNTPANPAARGSIITIYATGEGLTDPLNLDGRLAIGTLPKPRLPVSVTIGGFSAEVLFASVAPSMAGVFTVAVRVPSSASSGTQPLAVTVGGSTSPQEISVEVK